MEKKPSYEELEQKIKDLDKLNNKLEEHKDGLLHEINELRLTSKHYDILMKNTEDYFVICDRDGRPQAYNESYKNRIEKIIKKKMTPGMEPYKYSGDPEAYKYWKSLHDRVMKGEKFKADYSYDTDSKKLYFETLFCPVKNGKEITGFTEITREITDRKITEEALRESLGFISGLLEHSPNAIIVFNTDTSVKYVNPAFEKLTGYSSEEALNTKAPYPWWIDTPEYGTVEERLKLGRNGLQHAERCYKKKNGENFWVDLNVNPVLENGRLSYSLSTWIDITENKRSEKEKKRLEEKLQRSQKMESLGLLAGGVAHDLNNILSGIVSYPELLLLDIPEESTLRKPLETIRESGNRAVAIVQDLITIARGVATTKKPVNINNVINDYLNSPEFRHLEQHNPSITYETIKDDSLFNINGSYAHLKKIIINLVANASEAIEKTGVVTISTKNRHLEKPLKAYDDVRTGDYAVLSVSDNGTGISPADLNRIFEPFYSKKMMGRSGTGLGLPVVWNVVQEHDGYINVTSGEQGTTFDLYFPITRTEISGADTPFSFDALKGNGEKILVVDDLDNQRIITGRFLERLGYDVHTAGSGEEAVEYLKENSVDLVILDMIMDPGINGRETYERIIKIHPFQKAVIVSGYAETDDVKATLKMGAGQFIRKPITLQTLGISVREELRKS
ncbi:MAG: PAS domain S-box protein [Deltaproteobacteria bacterium]|nr:PAS domain S-box protein [Deltaproteobacteria bacterium]